MRSRLFTAAIPLPGLILFMGAGCTQSISADQLAQKVDKPADVQFFGDRAVYMGDKDGYRYVHVRDLFDKWTWLGECTYKIPDSEWPMQHPMPLTNDAEQWKDVEWLNGDAPPDVAQVSDLYITPAFPEGAPKTQPVTLPSMPPPQ
ncbi:MAG TPA: hypothetical protein VG326_08225 [Tepidisphaeraceae bacterium]|jgi:hypothetical protein|nr:hypothetical protein [Tepidisphaeraceae bacterium]